MFFVSFAYYPDRYASLLAYGSILYPAMQATHQTVLWRQELPSPSPEEWTKKKKKQLGGEIKEREGGDEGRMGKKSPRAGVVMEGDSVKRGRLITRGCNGGRPGKQPT
jgi:hypothetical protein